MSALTPRQREVAILIAEGASGQEIATRLAITPRTVEYHRYQIRQRLGLHSVAAVTRYVLRKRWSTL